MRKLNYIFQIIGVVATVFSAYIGYLALKNDTNYSESSRVDMFKLKVADVVAPEGYSLNNPGINVIKRNSHFSIKERDSAYLFQKERVPFSVKKGYSDRVSLLINGVHKTLELGDTLMLPDNNCTLWLYSIELKKYGLELRCGTT